MEKFRLLPRDYSQNSYMKMAVDEAVLIAVSNNLSPNTLRFYKWKKAAVSIGYFQELNSVVNVKKCQEDKIEIFRRLTGGGAVYKDPKRELNYSIIIKENFDKRLKKVLSSYKVLCNAIVLGLKELSISAEFKPINDIVINGKKISGNAQTRSNGTILQHGTILLDVDVDKMFSYLKVSNEKIKDKMITDVKQRVTSLKAIKNKKINFKTVERVIIDGFEKVLNVEFYNAPLTQYERVLAKKLYQNKYSKKEWNFWR